MYYGVGIFLVAVGAVLAFAFNGKDNQAGFNIPMVGWILLAVGVLAIVITAISSGSRRASSQRRNPEE